MMVLLAHQAKGFVEASFVHVFIHYIGLWFVAGRVVFFSILALISLCYFDRVTRANKTSLSSIDAFHNVMNGVAEVWWKLLPTVSQFCTYRKQRVHTHFMLIHVLCIHPCELHVYPPSEFLAYCSLLPVQWISKHSSHMQKILFWSNWVFLFWSAKNFLQPIFCMPQKPYCSL